jgi:RNA polymerase-binding protein DksA
MINKSSIEEYRQKLTGVKIGLLTSLGFNFKKLADSERNSDDDLIVALQDEFLHSGLDRMLYEQLRGIDAALARLDTREYGSCSSCGISISSKRLQAIPWATHCVGCKDDALAVAPQEAVSLQEV